MEQEQEETQRDKDEDSDVAKGAATTATVTEEELAGIVNYVREMEASELESSIIDQIDDQEPWFEVIIHLAASPDPQQPGTPPPPPPPAKHACLRKAWSDFQRLHYLLLTDEFGCDDAVKALLPPLPTLAPGDADATAAALNSYMQRLLAVPAVLASAKFSGFLGGDGGSPPEGGSAGGGEGEGGEAGGRGEPQTAIGFLLQPFAPHCVYVPRRQEYSRELVILKGESVAWRFDVDCGLDIDFTVEFTPCEVHQRSALVSGEGRRQRGWLGYVSPASEGAGGCTGDGVEGAPRSVLVHRRTRYPGGARVQGSCTSAADGLCALRWGNGHSRLRGKRLYFVAEAVDAAAMRAAVQAADACAFKASAARGGSAQQRITPGAAVSVDVAALRASAAPSDAATSDATLSPGGGDPPAGRFSLTRSAYNLVWNVLRLSPYYGLGAGGGQGGAGGGRAALPPAAGEGGGGGREGGGLSEYEERVATLLVNYERLEDELAGMSARRAQAEAQTKVLLAQLQRAKADVASAQEGWQGTRAELCEMTRRADDMALEREEALQEAHSAERAQLQAEERLLAARRECELLQAERSVWQVARSGIQSELARAVGALETEKHAHEDARAALKRSQTAVERLEAERQRLAERVAAAGDREAQERLKEEAAAARAESEDVRVALAEVEAETAKLSAQKRLLVVELRQQKKAFLDQLSAVQAEAEEARMMQRAAETRLKKLEGEG
ncbi:hypothetical protein JKP88DRAFT_260832, partial [Tribonema minus]